MTHSLTKNKKIIWYVLGIILLLLLYIILSILEGEVLIPSLKELTIDLFKIITTKKYILLLLKTIIQLLLIITVSTLLSMALAYLSLISDRFKTLLSPIMTFIRTIPIASFVVILLILIGSKITPTVITLFITIPIMYESFYSSIKTIDKEILEETKLISKMNLYVFLKLILPIKIINIISTILSCFGLGLKVLIMSEVITQGSDTIGGIIANEKSNYFNMTRVFSWTIILIIIILIIEIILQKMETKIHNKMY